MAQVDLNTIKANIKTILDAANTTTGSPIDLSANMNERVNRIMKTHPGKIPQQTSFFPLVTMYYDGKDVEIETIAATQAKARRISKVDLKIVAIVQESLVSSVDEDESDEQIEVLIENVEEVLRSNDTLSNSVKWHKPIDVQFHAAEFDEMTIIRAATLTIELTVEY